MNLFIGNWPPNGIRSRSVLLFIGVEIDCSYLENIALIVQMGSKYLEALI